VLKLVDGAIKRIDEPALTALNMRLRDDYTSDCENGIVRWNKIIETYGIGYRLSLPHVAFNRHIGEFRNAHATPQGVLVSEAEWSQTSDRYLPSSDDAAFIESLMKPEARPGHFANWIAPPRVGIDNKPGDFEYVKIAA
jgi:benzoyl-CoA 2,3-dioxygenase component B